ncbi:MAG: alpha/beta fold hydrolase [Chromatiales bacterium]
MALIVAACATTPSHRYDTEAQHLGFQREVVPGTAFSHVVYMRPSQSRREPLHVYLESDGSPWIGSTRIAADPTPTEPVALRLMRLDPLPAALVGRPCYNGMHSSPPCRPALWTHGRYSEAVVASMAVVIRHLMQQHGTAAIVLIGYSGGGTLAMLLAERLPDVAAVVTLAGNLDTDRWTEFHDYSPLTGSLNPASRPPLPSRIVQWHVAGGRDRNVPLALINDEVKRQPNARLRVLPKADHACCWEQAWPQILEEIEVLSSARAP